MIFFWRTWPTVTFKNITNRTRIKQIGEDILEVFESVVGLWFVVFDVKVTLAKGSIA